MSSIDEDLKLKILEGGPILLQKTNGFFIHRTIRDIIKFGYLDFLRMVQLFLISDEDIQQEMPVPGMTTFLYFLIMLNNEGEISNLIKKGISFFLDGDNVISDAENKVLLFSYKEIDNIEINEEGFKEIVNYIKIVYNGSFIQEEKQQLSEAEKRMKEKFDRLRAQREAAKKQSDSISFSDMLGGFTMRNYALNWEDVLNLSYYTFFFLLKKLRKYDDYELQLRARLAGADIKEELHHWLSHDEEEE